MQQLEERYQRYRDEADLVRKISSPADGLFGFGNDPKNHPCHEQFYDDVGAWMQTFLETRPGAAEAYAAARFILGAPVECAGKESYWMMYAAQGWCRKLVDCLDAPGCAALRDYFDDQYPKRDRMPVQQELYKALKRGAGKR